MIVLDYETTGLLKPELSDIKEQPCITEICATKIDKQFNFIDELETLVKPSMPIPDFLVEMIGISNEMVADAPTFIDLYDTFYNFFLGEDIVVAHNCAFEMGVTRFELMRLGLEFKFPWPKTYLCTVERSYHIKNRRLKLGQLHELATGEELKDAHRAKSDVYGTIRSLQWLVEKNHIDLNKL